MLKDCFLQACALISSLVISSSTWLPQLAQHAVIWWAYATGHPQQAESQGSTLNPALQICWTLTQADGSRGVAVEKQPPSAATWLNLGRKGLLWLERQEALLTAVVAFSGGCFEKRSASPVPGAVQQIHQLGGSWSCFETPAAPGTGCMGASAAGCAKEAFPSVLQGIKGKEKDPELRSNVWEPRTGKWDSAVLVCLPRKCRDDAASSQAGTTTTRHPPAACYSASLWAWQALGLGGGCNFPRLAKVSRQHWPLFASPLCLKGQVFIQCKLVHLCWLSWIALEKLRRSGRRNKRRDVPWFCQIWFGLCYTAFSARRDTGLKWAEFDSRFHKIRFPLYLSTCGSQLKY